MILHFLRFIISPFSTNRSSSLLTAVACLEDFAKTSSRENEYSSKESSCLVYSKTVMLRNILRNIHLFGVILEYFLKQIKRKKEIAKVIDLHLVTNQDEIGQKL